MSPELAGGLVIAVGAYLAAGLLFAVPFALFGAGAIEPKAREAGWGFRVLIIPGSAALWPLLARRWLRASNAGEATR